VILAVEFFVGDSERVARPLSPIVFVKLLVVWSCSL